MVKNPRLAKAIMDCGWNQFVQMLEYKSEWYGKEVIRVNPHYTSRDCSSCGFRTESMPLSTREWTCEKCGAEHHRDVNAALNILAAGHAVKTCGADVRPAVLRNGRLTALKQEA
jgi:putative transposase